MDKQLLVVTNQIAVFAMLMAIGFIAAKMQVLTKEALTVISRLIVKIILPALIFSVVAGSGVTVADFMISGTFVIAVVLCFLLLNLSGVAMSKLCRLEGKTANVFIALSTFGNIGFMGIPLIMAIFTEPIAQVCISVYTLVDMALLWTVGVYLCSRHQKTASSLHAMKNIINPTTVALFVALIIVIFNIPVPSLLMNTIAGVGGTSKFLALMYIGGALAHVTLSEIWRKPSIFLLAIVKMVLLPVLAYYLLGFLLPSIPRFILTLIVGLPPMAAIVMLAAAYRSDDEYATETVFALTLASLVTIPLVSGIISLID